MATSVAGILCVATNIFILFSVADVCRGTCEELKWWTVSIHHYTERGKNCNSYTYLLQESAAGENTWYATVYV